MWESLLFHYSVMCSSRGEVHGIKFLNTKRCRSLHTAWPCGEGQKWSPVLFQVQIIRAGIWSVTATPVRMLRSPKLLLSVQHTANTDTRRQQWMSFNHCHGRTSFCFSTQLSLSPTLVVEGIWWVNWNMRTLSRCLFPSLCFHLKK